MLRTRYVDLSNWKFFFYSTSNSNTTGKKYLLKQFLVTLEWEESLVTPKEL